MKYGIISDIHGNLEALQAAVPLLRECDEVLCAGDVVGYGPNPNECCELLRDRGWPTVQGNHDVASIGAYDLEWFNAVARVALDWTAEQLTDENRAFLEGNPQRIDRDEFPVVHGSLVSPIEQYLETARDAQSTFDKMDGQVCFIGHTHVAMLFSRAPFHLLGDRRLYPSGGTVELRRRRKYVVNCGSLGQPRDRNPAGGLGIYDTEAGTVKFVRVGYDVGTTQRKMSAAGLPEWLIKRLSMGV